jgi:hypothetical protein
MRSLSDSSVIAIRWKDKCTVYTIALLFYILQKCTSQNLPIFHGLTFTSTGFVSTSEVCSHHIGISDNSKVKNQKMGKTVVI